MSKAKQILICTGKKYKSSSAGGIWEIIDNLLCFYIAKMLFKYLYIVTYHHFINSQMLTIECFEHIWWQICIRE